MSRIPIYPEVGDHPVGNYDDRKRTYHKSVKGRFHIYNSPPSICNDVTILDRLQKLGCLYLDIYHAPADKHYWASLKLVLEKGFRIPDYGYGSQWALPLRYWTPEQPPIQESMQIA